MGKLPELSSTASTEGFEITLKDAQNKISPQKTGIIILKFNLNNEFPHFL